MKKSHATVSKSLSRKIGETLIGYFKTQFIVILVVTLVVWIMLTGLGVQFPLLLALITGATSVIPILGITAAAIVVSLVAIFDATRFLPNMPVVVEGLAVIALYGVLNMIVDYFLSPYLVGKSVGVPPVVLLILVIAGTAVFGLWGAFLSVPIALVAKTVLDHYRNLRF